jgi:HSP20 family protein
MALVKLQPRSLFDFGTDFDKILEGVRDSQRNGLRTNSDWNPPVDVTETENELKVEVDLPGLTKNDIKVNVESNVLTIEGEKSSVEKEEGRRYHRTERVSGSFKRSLRLSTQVDATKITATHKDGVLTLTLPKSEVAKPKAIAIQ